MRLSLAFAIVAAVAVLGGCGRDDAAPATMLDADPISVRVDRVAGDFGAPLLALSPPDDPRLFVVERPGRVWRVDGGRRDLYLDLSDEISEGGERGLLGLAFHPEFAVNGRLFVDYTDPEGNTRVDEIRARPGAERLDPAGRRLVLRVDQPEANHNGGHLLFGPDGYLYVGLGDGGGGGDPNDNGQDPRTPLGAILRIDVDARKAGEPYAIPDDNPFSDGRDGAPEVFVYGLRNPWRFNVDAATGDLWIGDVGQDEREEVSVLRAGEVAGANLGWPLREGTRRNRDGDDSDTVPPVVEYGHDTGCSVTGGLVSRGGGLPALNGRYIFGDYCTGRIFAVSAADPSGGAVELLPDSGEPLSELRSFGTDSAGRLYAVAGDGLFRVSGTERASGPLPPGEG